MMKVALVGPFPVDPERIAGGVAAVTFNLAKALGSHPEIELHVLSPTKELSANQTRQWGGITVHFMAHKRGVIPNKIRDIWVIADVLKTIQPDIVHSQTASGALAGTRAGFPTVETIHGIPQQEIRFAKNWPAKQGARLTAWLTRLALKRVDERIAISQYVIESFPEFSCLGWHKIHNPIEDRFFEINGREIPHKMLFAGVMYERKNIPGLIRAFHRVCKKHNRAELFICGKVMEPEIFTWAESYLEANGLKDRVRLLGFVSMEELSRHYAEAAVICLLSREETAPMIIAQAMCSGKPVVSSSAGGVPDLMVDGETGFVVDVEDEDGFSIAALSLLNDEELRRQMGKRGRELAEELFRAESVAAKTIDVYKKALMEK